MGHDPSTVSSPKIITLTKVKRAVSLYNMVVLEPSTSSYLTPDLMELIHSGQLKHVAIIMDGNRRWAEKNQMMGVQGHYHGYQALKKVAKFATHQLQLPVLTVFAFSTENWNRSEKEITFLTGLLEQVLSNDIDELIAENLRLKFIGDLSRFPKKLHDYCRQAEKRAELNTGTLFQVALNYGGRAEFVHACQQIAVEVQAGELSVDQITEDTVSRHLYTADTPDPDLVIRTGGEYRVSNFLLWQAAYSELYTTPLFWPEFDPKALCDALADFQSRKRRYGK